MVSFFAIVLMSSIGIYRMRKRKQEKKIAKDSIRMVTPELAPEVVQVKKIEEIIQSPIEDVAKSERIEVLVKEPKGKILEIKEQYIQPSSWITQFPPIVSECEKEIYFLFNLVTKRQGRWYGRTSYNFLLKHKTDDISVTNLRKIYMILPQQTTYFEKEKTSIVITEVGKRIASSILKGDDKL